MASGKSVELRYIFPVKKTVHNDGTPYVNLDKDRRLAGKKRVKMRKYWRRRHKALESQPVLAVDKQD